MLPNPVQIDITKNFLFNINLTFKSVLFINKSISVTTYIQKSSATNTNITISNQLTNIQTTHNLYNKHIIINKSQHHTLTQTYPHVTINQIVPWLSYIQPISTNHIQIKKKYIFYTQLTNNLYILTNGNLSLTQSIPFYNILSG
jgi:hypothetical protein